MNNSIFSSNQNVNRYESFLGNDNIDSLLGNDDFMGDDDFMGGDEMAGSRSGPQEQFYPFTRTSFATGVSADITGRPQRKFRTERLVVASIIAADFTFSRLLIGQDNMFVANGDASCQLFSEAAVGMRLRGYTAVPGLDITITVTNRAAGTLVFSGGIVGSAVARAS